MPHPVRPLFLSCRPPVCKNNNEKEFIQAVTEFMKSIDLVIDQYPEIEKYNIIERITEPDRLISFKVSWVDDNGNVVVNRGFRVQFNSAIGPYKGGIRFNPTVNQSIIKFLGFEQIFKNSLTGLPMGGGKGGSDFDPKGKSDFEIMRFCQAFMSELYRHIGADLDVPAGDLGVGAREVGFLFGYYKKLKNEFTGTFTGKGLSFGGSLARTEATGYGVCYFANEALKVLKGDSFKNKRVIVSGSGNVAMYCAMKAKELGATVVAMSDTSGYIYNESGLNLEQILAHKSQKKPLATLNDGSFFSTDKKAIWKVKCDMAFPCATQNELDLDDAKALVENGVILVCEGANMPSTNEAAEYFVNSKIIYGPGKAANAGGVATSGLEMSQNSMRLHWSFEEVDQKLKEIMVGIFNTCYETSIKINRPGDLVAGANIAGFLKVCDAMIKEGVI